MIDPNIGAAPHIVTRAFQPKSATADEWRAYHAYVRQRAADDEPDEPVLPDDVRQRDMLIDWPLSESHRRLATIDGHIVGQLTMWTRRPGTGDYDAHAHRISVAGGVCTDARRQGVGITLLADFEAFMRENSYDLATMEAWTDAGKAFLEAIGAGEKQRMSENRLELARVDPAVLRGWETLNDADLGPGLTWEIHAGRVPLDRYTAMAPQLEVMLNSQPKGTLDWPPYRIHLEQITAWYADMDAHGGDHIMALLISGDEIVAMSEVTWPSDFPDRAYQGLTAVADGWRSKGYAKAVKARLFRAVAERHPSVRLIITNNATVNAAMLAVNRQLGFELHRETRTYQIDRDAIVAAVARRSRAR